MWCECDVTITTKPEVKGGNCSVYTTHSCSHIAIDELAPNQNCISSWDIEGISLNMIREKVYFGIVYPRGAEWDH